jgi:hypothetical protein
MAGEDQKKIDTEATARLKVAGPIQLCRNRRKTIS